MEAWSRATFLTALQSTQAAHSQSSEGTYAAQLLHGHQQAALLGQRPVVADDGFSTSSHHR